MELRTVLRFVVSGVILLLIRGAACQPELCQNWLRDHNRDEFRVGNKRMVLFSREKNWHDAFAHCESIGMRLLTTSTKNEVELLTKYLNSRVWDTRPDLFFWYLWMGANDIDQEGVWVWKTLEGRNFTYVSWGGGEPNGGRDENCLDLRMTDAVDSWWNDSNCNVRRRYICEVEDSGLN